MTNSEQQYQQQFDQINRMIATAKQEVADNSQPFIYWGWILFLASTSHFFLFHYITVEYSYLPWPILCGLGGVFHMVFAMKQHREKRVTSYLDRFLGYLWGSFLVSLLLILFFSFYLKIPPTPFVLAITGLATFATGGIIKSLPVRVGGVVFWVAMLICVFFNPIQQLLVFGGAILLGYLVPGYILKSQGQ